MVTGFKSLADLLIAFPNEQACIDYLERNRWGDKVVSPFDPSSKVYKCKDNRYHCKSTGKYFNVKTGTLFEGTQLPLQKWFMAAYLFSCHKKGISSYQLARDLGITQKSAWFMLHRMRYAVAPDENEQLTGEIEMDETYVGGKEGNKHKDKKIKESRGRSAKGKVPVFGMMQRGGNVIAKVVKDTRKESLEPHIIKHVEKGARVNTDEWSAYDNLHMRYDHVRVSHGAGEYGDGMVSTNGVENFWSHMKRTILGIYHHVSPRLLFQYVNESTFRFNTRDMDSCQRLGLMFRNNNGRLRYQTLIGD